MIIMILCMDYATEFHVPLYMIIERLLFMFMVIGMMSVLVKL